MAGMAVVGGAFACTGSPVGVGGQEDPELVCSLPTGDILAGQRRDGIPALTNPETAFQSGSGTEYLQDSDRIVGIVLDGEPIAIPLNIFWWHEIVNLEGPETAVAVTHCPLTGSSIAFQRGHLDDVEFGVSGLLYQNNLIMYDRSGPTESLWPQMLLGARCGPRDGESLPTMPIVETTWEGWTWLHPGTRVVTSNTGYERDYRAYPYGSYSEEDSPQVLFPLSEPLDRRRPPKELVLGVPSGTGGMAFPFGELDAQGDVAVVQGSLNGQPYVVFWERSRQGAMAFFPEVDGDTLDFRVVDGRIRDVQTGSEWRMDGRAVFGPREGESLRAVEEAFVAFWFAWPAFYPDIRLWSGS